MVQLSLSPVISQNLFSQNYLQDRLKEDKTWSGLKEHKGAFEEIKALYEREKGNFGQYNEAQLEDHFIKPILRILGHAFEVQAESGRSASTPDYAFFPNEEARVEALQLKEEKEFYSRAIAVGDAKRWGTPLDKKSSKRAQHAQGNPSLQIERYLRITGLQWGILTNGRYWRLYYEKTSGSLDSYFEVDLATILDTDSETDFKYFYLFFRREAFLKDFLQQAYDQSYTYAKKVEGNLEKSVYKALRVLAQGFFTWSANNLKPDPGTIDLVHRNCLILLYRLLFILYADSKGALKVSKEGYEHYDINKIKFQAFTQRKAGAAAEHSPAFWNRLNDLFALIDEGSEAGGIKREELYVPPYNGGLFDRGEHPFLNEKKVGDKYLTEVLGLLTMDTEGEMAQSIDYSPLEIRHLGSIYEGLLEYKLRAAEEDLVAVKEKDRQVWVPRGKAEGKKVLDEARKGELYLVTDKGERKATGSYYTPDYIVKYIVENTLGPVVEEKLKGCATDEERIEAILSIKVLDPAMGSGHFLVEATEFLAKRLLDYLPEELVGEEKEIRWARREVVKRCIHGVDLNPLATELAKLSLWLSTFEPNRPLSFLDHHLRVGNSLIGADIRRLGKHPAEAPDGTVPTLISDFVDKDVQEKVEIFVNMHLTIMRMAEEDVKDIKAKEETYRQLTENPFRQAFKQLANLHTSYWLGNKFSKEEYHEALEAFRQFSRDRSKWEKVREKEYFKRAQELAEGKRFFHWMLAFPDIFFGERQENPGFDAVVGNPPYIRDRLQQEVSENNFFSIEFRSAYQKYDIYAIFVEKGIYLLKSGGDLGFIIPNKFMAARYAIPLREILLKDTSIKYIVDVSQIGVFPNISVYPHIIVLERISEKIENKIEFSFVSDVKKDSMIFSNVKQINQSVFSQIPDKMIISSMDSGIGNITTKIKNKSVQLGELCNINEGVHTGNLRDKLLVETKIDDKSYPVYTGENFGRYESVWGGKFIRYDWSIIKNEPNGYGSLREEKIFIAPEKIICREIHTKISCTYDNEQKYFLNHLYSITHKIRFQEGLLFITSLLNSKTLSFFFDSMFMHAHISGGYRQYKAFYLEQLPIRRISFTTPPERRASLVDEAKALYSEFLGSSDSRKLLDFVGMRLDAKPEESDVVHDLLAFLAERMIEMNREKNGEIRGFLGWLEGEVGAKVEDLQNKTAIKEYHAHPFEDMVKVLKKNRAKLALDPGRREFQERLRGEYDSSTAKLTPLLAKVENTDRLIDQVVYKLYGLTEEEIRVVEGG